MEKNTFSYAISNDKLKEIFKVYFESLGYKDVEMENINHHISSKYNREENEVKITLDLLCSMVSFKSSGRQGE